MLGADVVKAAGEGLAQGGLRLVLLHVAVERRRLGDVMPDLGQQPAPVRHVVTERGRIERDQQCAVADPGAQHLDCRLRLLDAIGRLELDGKLLFHRSSSFHSRHVENRLDRGDHLGRRRMRQLLQVGGIRHRHVGAGDLDGRRVEVVEGLDRGLRADLRADRAHGPRLLHGDEAVGLAYGGEHRLEVERTQACADRSPPPRCLPWRACPPLRAHRPCRARRRRSSRRGPARAMRALPIGTSQSSTLGTGPVLP